MPNEAIKKDITESIDIEKIKNIFGRKDNALSYIKDFYPETFKIPKGCRKERFIGGDPYVFIQKNWNFKSVRKWLITHCCIKKDGKFYDMYNNYEKCKQQLQDYQKEREDLQNKLGDYFDCLPDAFSDQIVKPMIRGWQKNFTSLADREKDEAIEILKLKIHNRDRAIAQLKNDLAEYVLLVSGKNYLPTLRHNVGDDGYFFNKETGKIEDGDVKTSRWPRGKTKLFGDGVTRKEAAIALYSHQGVDRFSSNPRVYLVFPSINGERPKDNLSVAEQLSITFNLEFSHINKRIKEKYGESIEVKGVKLVFLDNVFLTEKEIKEFKSEVEG